MPLINCKIHLKNSTKNCVMSNIGVNTTFKITSTLSTKDKVNLTKQLNEEFKRSVYWNKYKSKIDTKPANDQTLTSFPLDASFQGVTRLFVLAFNDDNNDANKAERDNHRKYFLPRV